MVRLQSTFRSIFARPIARRAPLRLDVLDRPSLPDLIREDEADPMAGRQRLTPHGTSPPAPGRTP